MERAGRGAMVVGLLAAAFAGGAFMQWLTREGSLAQAAAGPAAAKELRAQAFVLVDARGRPRAALRASAEGSSLVILGVGGKPAVEIGADREGPGIGLRDGKTGRLLVGIGSDQRSTAVDLFDQAGTQRVSLGTTASGAETAIGVFRGEGRPAVSLGYGPTGTGLSVWDDKGRERAGVGMPPWAGASFVTKDENGKDTWRAP